MSTDLELRCPVCVMKLPATFSSDTVGRIRVLCVSKTCGKVFVVFDNRVPDRVANTRAV